jgi:hypothetical protein
LILPLLRERVEDILFHLKNHPAFLSTNPVGIVLQGTPAPVNQP